MNTLKYASVIGLWMLSMPTYADSNLGPSTLPGNVAAVYPQPDSRIDIGPNASPMGAQQISVLFRKEVIVNSECEGEACIYREGDDTPLQTVGISGVSVDFTQPKMGCVLFPNSCNGNGTYRVTIPDGFWILEGETPAYSGALDLYYEILNPQTVTPAEGVVKELSEFKLEFPDYQEARLLKANKIDFFKLSSSTRYPITVTEGKNEDGSPANYLLIKLDNPVTEQGEYSLFVQAGAAECIRYGEGPGQDDVTTERNIEALYRYTVSQINAPTILPAEGVLQTFNTFELTVSQGMDFWFVNDKAQNFMYKVNEDGSLAPDPSYKLTGRRIEDSDKILLTINDNGQILTDVTPEPGAYALQLASGLFSGSIDGDFINSAPFVYYYNVIDIAESVNTPAASKDGTAKGIYSIDGKKISDDSNFDPNRPLPEGVYIINGKKILITPAP